MFLAIVWNWIKKKGIYLLDLTNNNFDASSKNDPFEQKYMGELDSGNECGYENMGYAMLARMGDAT